MEGYALLPMTVRLLDERQSTNAGTRGRGEVDIGGIWR